MLRRSIKGTTSIYYKCHIATAVLYELRWKIWNLRGVNLLSKLMTNTVEFTEWSELLNHSTNLGTIYACILREFLNSDVVSKPDKARGVAECLISFSFKNSHSILATVP